MRRNILLVDDDPHIVQLVNFFLSQAGFAVKIERDGFSAMTTLQSAHFDLLLLDISMPHMNGFKVLKAVRDIEAFKALPIIILTGSSDKADIIKAKSFGADDYVVKPPTKDDLFKRVERLLGGRPQLEEFVLEVDSTEAQGQMNLAVALTSLSKRGIIARSKVPLERGERVEGLDLKLFRDLGIHKYQLNVADCTKLETGGYELFLSFVNLNSADQQKIFDWIYSNTAKRRNSAAG